MGEEKKVGAGTVSTAYFLRLRIRLNSAAKVHATAIRAMAGNSLHALYNTSAGAGATASRFAVAEVAACWREETFGALA